jgi:hypothetical protein
MAPLLRLMGVIKGETVAMKDRRREGGAEARVQRCVGCYNCCTTRRELRKSPHSELMKKSSSRRRQFLLYLGVSRLGSTTIS